MDTFCDIYLDLFDIFGMMIIWKTHTHTHILSHLDNYPKTKYC